MGNKKDRNPEKRLQKKNAKNSNVTDFLKNYVPVYYYFVLLL